MPTDPHPTLEDIERAPVNLPSASHAHVTLEMYLTVMDRLHDASGKRCELEFSVVELERQRKTDAVLNDLVAPFARQTFWFMCGYCGFVGALLLSQARGEFANDLDVSVLKILVGSTAVTVIGLVGTILTGIFIGARKR